METNSGTMPEYPLAGLTLLLSDDEVRLRQIVILMAQELGAKVIAVETSEKAVATYREKKDEIDLVMLDLRMNGMDGETAYKEIKAFDPAARIVISSGIRPDRPFLEELASTGCTFIEKPFDIDGLSHALYTLSRK